MRFKAPLAFYQNLVLLVVLVFLGSCNLDPTDRDPKENESSVLIPNLEREAPIVWHINEELYCYMYWIGNFETKVDTVITFDPATYNETLSIYNQTIREGIWYLKDCDHKIYAESRYKNDSLVSIKKIRTYKESYNEMQNIGAFEKSKLVRKEINYH